LLNASVDWRDLAGKPLDVSLFGKNLTDKRYFTGSAALNFASVNVAEPRTYGLQLRYRFGKN
jgi:iron complex outermembrane receptor protein